MRSCNPRLGRFDSCAAPSTVQPTRLIHRGSYGFIQKGRCAVAARAVHFRGRRGLLRSMQADDRESVGKRDAGGCKSEHLCQRRMASRFERRRLAELVAAQSRATGGRDEHGRDRHRDPSEGLRRNASTRRRPAAGASDTSRRRRIGSRIEAHGLPHGLPRASLRPFEGPSKRAPVPES
jgi:hypothetical protein